LGGWEALRSASAAPPNKRLKLTGAYPLKGNGVLCPGGHGLSSNTLAPAGRSPAAYARSGGRDGLCGVSITLLAARDYATPRGRLVACIVLAQVSSFTH